MMLGRSFQRVSSAQIEYQGLYSVERLHLLQTYITTKFSVKRLAALIFATPWPCAATIVLLDTFPLAPPSAGTNANFVFWLRSTVTVLFFTLSFVLQAIEAISMLKLSWMQITSITFAATAGAQLSGYGLSLLIGFPVPFSLILESPIWLILLWTSLAITSSHHIRSHPGGLAALFDFAKVTVISVSQLVVYPAYSYVFSIVPASSQAALCLILSSIKIAYRYALGKTVKEQADRKAEIVSFHAEISHALFVTFSMQSASSIWTMVVLLLVDLVHALITLHDVQSLVSCLEKLELKLENERIYSAKCRGKTKSVIERAQSGIARSSFDNKLSSDMVKTIMINKKCPLKKQQRGFLSSWRRAARLAPSTTLVIAPIRVQPSSMTSVTPLHSSLAATPKTKNAAAEIEAEIVKTVRQLLYLTEFVILGEFVEFIVPVIYTFYVAVVIHLPNRAYFPQLANMDADNLGPTLLKMMSYGFLELVSLFLVDWMLRSRLQFSPTAQLALVLETQWKPVAAELIIWVVYTVQATLQHHGTDYSFAFSWLHKNSTSDAVGHH